jgi:hypothetical protein
MSPKSPPDAYDIPLFGFLTPGGNFGGGTEKLGGGDEDEDEAAKEEVEEGEGEEGEEGEGEGEDEEDEEEEDEDEGECNGEKDTRLVLDWAGDVDDPNGFDVDVALDV